MRLHYINEPFLALRSCRNDDGERTYQNRNSDENKIENAST